MKTMQQITPERKMRTVYRPVEVVVFCCGHCKRGHHNEQDAIACMQKKGLSDAARTRKAIDAEAEATERKKLLLKAIRAVVNGATLSEAGRIIGVSASRARELLSKAYRISNHPRFNDKRPAGHFYWSPVESRLNPDYWFAIADMLEAYWLPKPETAPVEPVEQG